MAGKDGDGNGKDSDGNAGKRSIGNLLSGTTRLLIMGVVVCLLGSLYWWQSMGVWCDILQENPSINLGSSAYSTHVKYVTSLYCGFSQLSDAHSTAMASFVRDQDTFTQGWNATCNCSSTGRLLDVSEDRGFLEQNMSDESPNVVSWKSQWENWNLTWPAEQEEMEILPPAVIASRYQKLFDLNNAVYQSSGCGKARPGPAILHVRRGGVLYGSIPCPVLWICGNPTTAPKMLAVCWDPKFYDPPYPASLPTEQGPGFTTPELGDKAVGLNNEYRGGIMFMRNVYTNWQSQLFDSKHIYTKGGCAETAGDMHTMNESSIVRHDILINLAHSLAYNQYHGLIELFTRWVLMLPIIRALPNVPILVTKRDTPHISEMLKFVGITTGLDEFNVTFIKRTNYQRPEIKPELAYADVMILPQNPVCSGTSGALWDYIRQHYFRIPYTKKTAMEKGDSWYLVLSERTKSRGIIQQEALLAGLIKLLGKEKVKVFSDTVKWTKEEQRQLFSGAAIYVAGHGAGLSNMVFMPYHSSIIEVRPTGWSNRCYHYVADMLRFPFYRFDSPGVKASNLTVDVTHLLALVSAIVQAKGHTVPFYPVLKTTIVKG